MLIVRIVVFPGHRIERAGLVVWYGLLEVEKNKGAPDMESNAITNECYEEPPIATNNDQSCSYGSSKSS